MLFPEGRMTVQTFKGWWVSTREGFQTRDQLAHRFFDAMMKLAEEGYLVKTLPEWCMELQEFRHQHTDRAHRIAHGYSQPSTQPTFSAAATEKQTWQEWAAKARLR